MGIRRIPNDFNTGDNEGVSYFHVNQKRGRRWSSARGFSETGFLTVQNLRLGTKNVLVDRLIVENGRAVGRALHRKAAMTWSRPSHQGRSGAVCAAIDRIDAGILHRSGIGPADWLSPLGIDVVLRPARRRTQSAGPSAAAGDLPGRGRPHPERDLLVQSGPSRPGWGIDYALPPPRPADHGAVATPASSPAPDPHRERANIQFHVQPLSLDKFGGSPASLPRRSPSRPAICNRPRAARSDCATLNRRLRRRSHRIICPRTKIVRSRPMRSASRGG